MEETKEKTLTEIVHGLEMWEAEHKPEDVMGRLPGFRFVYDTRLPAVAHGGTSVPGLIPLGGISLPAVQLMPHAHEQLCARLQYPVKLYQKLPGNLNDMNVNWLIQHGAYDSDVMIRMIDGSQGRAIMSAKFEPFDNLELLKLLEPFCGEAIVRWHFDDLMTFHASLSFPKLRDEIRVGDIVERGIHVSNSEVGVRSVTIAGYVFRLRCKNGAVSTGGDGVAFRFRHVGDHERLMAAVQGALDSVMMETQGLIAAFKVALTERIADPYKMIEDLSKERQLTQEEYKAALDAYIAGASQDPETQGTKFGVSQAFSAASAMTDGERRFEMQRLSADVARRTN